MSNLYKLELTLPELAALAVLCTTSKISQENQAYQEIATEFEGMLGKFEVLAKDLDRIRPMSKGDYSSSMLIIQSALASAIKDQFTQIKSETDAWKNSLSSSSLSGELPPP